MEEGWNLIIYVQFGFCNFSTVGFMKFRGGSRGGGRATPEGGGGEFFWDGRGVVHDYKYKVWSL